LRLVTTSAAKSVPLDETRVLDAAFAVLEAHGFEGLTIRRIADALGVKNPALYWHFRNKQEIVTGMAGRLLDRLAAAPITATDWRGWFIEVARWYRRTLLSVRDGAEILSNASLAQSPHFAEFERGVAFLTGHGFSHDDATLGMITVFDFALGVTYEQQADMRGPADEREKEASRFVPAGMDRQALREQLFEGGLALILDGLAQRRH
jgi:TetR/AcrR family tetracycline transcriptional repressor